MWFLAHGVETRREEIVSDQRVWRSTPFFAWLVFLPVLLMTVFGRPRSDTYLYLSVYQSLPNSLSGGWAYVKSAKEPGFALFQILIKWLTGGSTTAFRLAMALVQTIPVVIILRRHSIDYLFSIYVFIAGGNHLGWMMNGIRQFMAVTIIFAATPWIVNKRYVRSVLVVLLAASFHRSAIFMLPVIFIVQGKAWNVRTLLFSVAAVGATFLFSRNEALFDEFADSVGYSMKAVHEWGDDGAHPLRVLVAAVPMALSFLAREKLRQENTGIINVCTNMSVITTGVTLVAMVTSGIMVGRMPIYTSLYNLILLPYVIKEYFNKQTSELVKAAAVGFYFLYYMILVGF